MVSVIKDNSGLPEYGTKETFAPPPRCSGTPKHVTLYLTSCKGFSAIWVSNSMSPAPSSSRSQAASGSSAEHGYDERLEFLRSNRIIDGGSLPLRGRFEHRVKGAEGDVEAVYWPRRDGSKQGPEQLSLFILGLSFLTTNANKADNIGNPGLIDYYLPFLAHLYSLLPPTHAILCTSHIGHEAHLPAPTQPAELAELLESKIELVASLRSSLDAWTEDGQEKTKLVLIGHSLGGWLVCEIMKRLNRGEEVVHAGHLLFPSLGWMAKSWNGRVMWVCNPSSSSEYALTASHYSLPS
jgi:hypothetical protein